MSRSKRIARDVAQSLLAHRSRAMLMMLGLAVGVAVLSAVIVIGQGTRAEVMALVAKHGLDMVMVRAGGDAQVFAPQADRGLASLMELDARAIEAEVPGVVRASVVQNQRGVTVVAGDRSVVTRAFGVEPAWRDIRRWPVAEGEFVTDDDSAALARVVVLGAKVARELFPQGGAVGQTVRIANDPYTVKGVFDEVGTSAGGDDYDDRFVVPFTTSSRRLFNRPYVEQIVFQVADASLIPEIADRTRALLRVRHGIVSGAHDDFFVREPEDVEGAALETSSTLLTLMLATSLVALLAGGLVIMNLMLMAVSQRAKEIGLRRAIGARTADISRQFLLESLFIALSGGVVGVAVGVLGAVLLELAGFTTIKVTWVPFVVAFAACVLVGLAFGIHPAKKAATLDPVASLRGRTT